jgi:hypothetical protein
MDRVKSLLERCVGKSAASTTSPDTAETPDPTTASQRDAMEQQTQPPAQQAQQPPVQQTSPPAQAAPAQSAPQQNNGDGEIDFTKMSREQLMEVAYLAAEDARMKSTELERTTKILEERTKREEQAKQKQLMESMSVFTEFIAQQAAKGDADAKKAAEQLKGGPESFCGEFFGQGTGVDGMTRVIEVVNCASNMFRNQVAAHEREVEERLRKRLYESPGTSAAVQQYAADLKKPRLDRWATSFPESSSSGGRVAQAPSVDVSMQEMQRAISSYVDPALMRDCASGQDTQRWLQMKQTLYPQKPKSRFDTQ